jgi:hypothetical protein
MYNFPASQRHPAGATGSSTLQENQPRIHCGYGTTQEQSLSSSAFGDLDSASDIFENGYTGVGGAGAGEDSQENVLREVCISVYCK